MESYCGSPFWDINQTWNTPDPYFTPCFEQTALVWFPVAILWLFTPLDIYWSFTLNSRNIPWSPLNVAKSLLNVVLIVLELITLFPIAIPGDDITYPIFPVDLYTPIIKVVSYTLALILLMLTKAKGVRSSGILFLFWLFSSLCEAIRFRTVLTSAVDNNLERTPHLIPYIVSVIYFPCLVALFVLNIWADVTPKYTKDYEFVEKPCPEKSASYASRLLYHWYTGLAWQGFRKPLLNTDLWDLNEEDRSRTIVPTFNKHWEQELIKAGKREAASIPAKTASYTKVRGTSVEFRKDKAKKTPADQQYTSILPALLRTFGVTFFFGSALKIIPDLMIFVSPQILDLLIAFVSDQEAETWKGYLYASILFLSAFLQTILMAQYSHRMYMTAMRVRTCLVSAVYRKALVVSNAAKRESTVGEIVNLMSVDVQKIMDLVPFVNMLWSAPLQIAVAMYFLWNILGPSVLAGLVVIILLVPANAIVAAQARKYQIAQMKHKDNRVKLMGEILAGIKVLKLYAWEPSFQSQITSIRDKEIHVLRQAAYLNAGTNFLWTCAPFLVSLATFATYVLIDEENVLDAQKAFVSLSLLNVINISVTFLPMIIVFLVQAIVSLKRLNKFMNAEEIDWTAVTHDASESDPIVIRDSSFSWGDEEQAPCLRNINLRVKSGALVAVVGSVGSGKSSLLSAILGELDKLTGYVNTLGSTGYVAQQAWIQNATLRDNILFGQAYDSVKYKRIIEACALKPDLDMLQGGDKTEIGEKGINLSGGQKQRVALARATYNGADVYLFDDPLSAVDAHVGKHIFDQVLGPNGLLKKKTRVLVTHGIAFLPQVDQIIVIKDGEISETGSYEELLAQKGAFAEFLSQHITVEDISEIDDSVIIKELEKAGVSLETVKARRRTRTGESDTESQTSTEVPRAYGRQSSSISARERRLSAVSVASTTANQNKLIEIEKSETESVKMTVYVDYFKAAGWAMTFSTFAFYLIFQGFAVGSNLWLSEWSNMDVNLTGTDYTSERDKYLGVYGALGFCQSIAVLVATIIMALATLKSAAVLHLRMLSHILKSPMSFFDTTPVGRIVNRFAKDIDICDNTLPFMLRLWMNSFLQVISTLLIISYTTPIFIAVVLPIGFIYYFVQRFYVSTSRQLKRLESITRSPIYSHFGETISGAPTIRAYKQQERFINDSESKVDYNQKSYFPAITSNRWLAVRLETVGNTVIFFAAVFAVISRETLNPGLVGLSVSYALQITIALNMLVRWTSDVETNIVAVERIKEYMEGVQEADWEVENRKPAKTWPEHGKVQFDHYKSRYREGLDLVLRDVTCTIEGGEKVGIVGRTGAGKSSLTLGLFRIVEAAGGSIIIDGHDISKLGLHDVRGRITIIPQDPVLFSGTLRLNLDPFEAHTDERIWSALELAHLKTFVKGLPAGMGHEITEGGENLSVGQRQLVCLARALLRKTKILVLDEATAAVDLETDDLIQQTIRTEFADSTVITIAHRLNTIMDSTRVIVLDKGEIREFDSPANLLANKNSIFYGMAQDAGL